jgi:hypothetical protein
MNNLSVEHVFAVLDKPVACTKCGRNALTVFDGLGICSRCAKVITPTERAAVERAIAQPFPLSQKFHYSPPRKENKMAEVEMLIAALTPEKE